MITEQQKQLLKIFEEQVIKDYDNEIWFRDFQPQQISEAKEKILNFSPEEATKLIKEYNKRQERKRKARERHRNPNFKAPYKIRIEKIISTEKEICPEWLKVKIESFKARVKAGCSNDKCKKYSPFATEYYKRNPNEPSIEPNDIYYIISVVTLSNPKDLENWNYWGCTTHTGKYCSKECLQQGLINLGKDIKSYIGNMNNAFGGRLKKMKELHEEYKKTDEFKQNWAKIIERSENHDIETERKRNLEIEELQRLIWKGIK